MSLPFAKARSRAAFRSTPTCHGTRPRDGALPKGGGAPFAHAATQRSRWGCPAGHSRGGKPRFAAVGPAGRLTPSPIPARNAVPNAYIRRSLLTVSPRSTRGQTHV